MQKYFSSYQCYHCDKKRHISRNCLTNKEEYKRKNNKIHHSNLSEEEEEPPRNLEKVEVEEYVL